MASDISEVTRNVVGDLACWVQLSENALGTRQFENVLNQDAIMRRRVMGRGDSTLGPDSSSAMFSRLLLNP